MEHMCMSAQADVAHLSGVEADETGTLLLEQGCLLWINKARATELFIMNR